MVPQTAKQLEALKEAKMLTLRRTANITISAAVVAATIIISGMANTAQAGKRERLIGAGIVAGVVGTAIIANERRKHRERRRHARHYDRYDSECYIKRRKVWSDYHGRRVWRKVEVCY